MSPQQGTGTQGGLSTPKPTAQPGQGCGPSPKTPTSRSAAPKSPRSLMLRQRPLRSPFRRFLPQTPPGPDGGRGGSGFRRAMAALLAGIKSWFRRGGGSGPGTQQRLSVEKGQGRRPPRPQTPLPRASPRLFHQGPGFVVVAALVRLVLLHLRHVLGPGVTFTRQHL